MNGTFIIPNDVTRIGRGAFYGCSGLTSITIPDSVTSIGEAAFAACTNLTSITVSAGNSVYHSADNCIIETATKTLIAAGCNTSIIPDDGSVTSIGVGAFAYCTRLTSIRIPDSVTSIGNCAFYNCSGLTSITIPDSVTSIGSYAFTYCIGLTSKKANYKAFYIKNGELYCRDKKYIEGVENSVQGALKMCENGIHYCTNLFEIFNYYYGELDKDIAIYEIEVGNEVLTSDTSKCCTNSCVLKKRLYKEDVIKILNTEGDNE